MTGAEKPKAMEEVMEEVRNNRVILLDLRDEDEFLFGHLPQARHIPFRDLAARVSELPADCPILAYCRGPYCVTALNGTSLLRDLGMAADRLRFGTPEWKAAGLPLEFDHNLAIATGDSAVLSGVSVDGSSQREVS
jgi:rhodanese-related sulfurtransferase